MAWIIENKEWLFSGVLVALPLALLGWILGKRAVAHLQRQKGGQGSVNIQAGGNVHLGTRKPDDEAESDRRR